MSDKKLVKLIQKGDLRSLRKALGKKGGLNGQDEKGFTLLHHAALNDRVAIISYLGKPCAEHDGADVGVVDNSGMTALMLAVFEKREGAVYELLAIGSDPNFRSKDGATVWDRADSHLPRSVVARMKAKAADARAKGNLRDGSKPNVYSYDGPVTPPAVSSARAASTPSAAAEATKSSVAPQLSAITEESSPLDKIGDTGAAINLDEVTQSVSTLALAVSGKRFGEEGIDILNSAVKPLFIALKNMESRVPRFVSDMPEVQQTIIRNASQRLSGSIKGLAPAVRELNSTPTSAAAFKALKEIVKRLVISSYRFYVNCIGGQTPAEVASAIQDNAHSTKMLLRVAYARTSEDALEKAYRMVATNTTELLKVVNAWSASITEQSRQMEVFEAASMVARATEGLIISAKNLFFAPLDPAARNNVTTLAKALASKYQALTTLTSTRTAPIPRGFDQGEHFLAAYKQLGAAATRYSAKAPAATLLLREKQVLLLMRNIVGEVGKMSDSANSGSTTQDNRELMISSRSISSDSSKIAAIALNTARSATGVVGQQLLACLQNALYFSMQTKLVACSKAVQVTIPGSLTSLALSLRGLASVVSLMVEAKLF